MHNKPIDAAEVIRDYAKPLFGFAFNRLRNRNEAEDLAQEIAVQLIKSLSSGTEIHNLDAYVWTIAKYCWVHWVNKQAKAPMLSELNGFSNLLTRYGISFLLISCLNPRLISSCAERSLFYPPSTGVSSSCTIMRA